jgi:hypothetical protein
MKNVPSIYVLGMLVTLLAVRAEEVPEATSDDQTMPQALALYASGSVAECEALISPEVRPEDWLLKQGYLLRAKNFLTLGSYAKEQDSAVLAHGIAAKVIELLDVVVPLIPTDDIPNRVFQLKLRATVEDALLGNSEQAEQLLLQATVLEPTPEPAEPLSPAEE